MSLTALDLFCGAGGSAIGLHAAGIDVKLAANHWQLAIDTHQLNFPDTDHDCADISQVDPRRYPMTDILWASPECTQFSEAQGQKKDMQDVVWVRGEPRPIPRDEAERSRATMWDVCRFTEAMMMRGRPYEAILIENVIEARQWGPRTAEHKGGDGTIFNAWLMAMKAMGYEYQIVYLNSAFAGGGRFTGILPAAQYRDRMYVVFTRKGARRPNLDVRPQAFCEHCDKLVEAVQSWKRMDKRWDAPHGKYRAQYLYRCPAPKCNAIVEPFTVPALAVIDWSLGGERIGDRSRPLAEGTMTRIQAGLDRYGNKSMLIPLDRNKDAGKKARSVEESFPTLTTRSTLGLAMPFIAVMRGGGCLTKADAITSPLSTVSANGNHHMLLNPDPQGWALALPYYRTGVARPVSEPLGTLTTKDRHAVVIPPGFVMRNNGSKGDGGEHCTPFHEPIRTLTTKGHQSVVIGADSSVSPEDCHFRMLQPHEQGAAMAFPGTYVVKGTKRQRTKQFGNAVTPPAAQLLATAVLESLSS